MGSLIHRRSKALPARQLNLKAVVAPNEAAAAQYYPAIYWYSMLKIPEASEFGGKGAIPAKITQTEWLNSMKNNGCIGCHQLGQLSTRTFPQERPHPIKFGNFPGNVVPPHPVRTIRRTNVRPARSKNWAARRFRYFADWTDRIAKGELPHTKPDAAPGSRAQHCRHHLGLARRQTLPSRPDRLGSALSDGQCLWASFTAPPNTAPTSFRSLIRKSTVTWNLSTPVRDANMPEALGPGHAASDKLMQPSPYWGDEKIWDTKANNHNGMIDRKGRVWFAARFRDAEQPGFCKKGSTIRRPSSSRWSGPTANSRSSIPRPAKYTFVDTCFGTHHLQFGYDANETLVDQRRRAGGRLGQHQDVR